MPDNCIDQLRNYFLAVAKVLSGEADAASVFPNTTDIGISREQTYKEFLKQHAPSKCNVFLGGYLFDEDGAASKQLVVIVTTDTAPRFDLHNKDGAGKAFSPVEGCLGVVSVKSVLNKEAIEDALYGLASIPPTGPLTGRVNPCGAMLTYGYVERSRAEDFVDIRRHTIEGATAGVGRDFWAIYYRFAVEHCGGPLDNMIRRWRVTDRCAWKVP